MPPHLAAQARRRCPQAVYIAPRAGRYRELLNSDSRFYGGTDVGNPMVETEAVPAMGYAQSMVVTLPPLAAVVLAPA